MGRHRIFGRNQEEDASDVDARLLSDGSRRRQS